MNDKLKELNNLIDHFKKTKSHFMNDSASDLKRMTDVEKLINQFKNDRTLFIENNIEYLRNKIKNNMPKLRVSALSLMEYDWNENSHSNILAYLIDYDMFEAGSQILKQIILHTESPFKEILLKKVEKEKYSVTRECKIPSGRLDLLVVDREEKFVIIIENKILAQIGKGFEQEEETNSGNQLKRYQQWGNESYKGYTSLFILLCFENDDDNLFAFEKLTYEGLFNCLETIKSSDNIFEEYFLLLRSLLNPISHDLLKIRKLANRIMRNESDDISLTEYHDLKTIIYGEE